MVRLMRVVKLAFALLLGAIAVWIEAVLETPRIKRRKALRRRTRSLSKS